MRAISTCTVDCFGARAVAAAMVLTDHKRWFDTQYMCPMRCQALLSWDQEAERRSLECHRKLIAWQVKQGKPCCT